MLAQTVYLPPKKFAAALKDQLAYVRDAASAFVTTTDTDGLGRALPRLLRDVLTISYRFDLERLPAADGQRLADLLEQHRAALHREFGNAVPAAQIDAGVTAAAVIAGMIGKQWSELEAIPDALLHGRVASVTMLANAIESATLADIAAQAEPIGAPAGVRLN